jgi:Zn2+/Cd2+-exporting ATPase
VVIIRPGLRIPVDGMVIGGQSAVDQSPVTGESVAVDKGLGAPVYAGTINKDGALEAHVTRLAEDSTLARVMHMVEEAQAQKSPTQQTVERFSRVFVPAVIGAALLLIVVPPLFGVPLRDAFLRSMTLLVAASPCALALGTPATVLAGVAQAARNGVLIKGSAHLENLGRLRAIAFDKTGTITYGRPVVTDVTPLDGMGPDALLFLTAAAESRSAHPLARAIVDAAQAARPGEPFPPVSAVESHTGRGLAARVNGTHVLAGNLALWTGAGVIVSPAVDAQVAAFEAAGRTTVAVALDGKPAGLLALADTLRPGIADTLAKLRRLGIAETVMLTGDNERVARAIAGAAGIMSYRAALLPEDKLAAIRELLARYGQVGMVGDGVNDAPALAHATVGIAMGGAGTMLRWKPRMSR